MLKKCSYIIKGLDMKNTVKINDKYTLVHDDGVGLHALRYGEQWRDLTGDGLVLAMAQEIEELRNELSCFF